MSAVPSRPSDDTGRWRLASALAELGGLGTAVSYWYFWFTIVITVRRFDVSPEEIGLGFQSLLLRSLPSLLVVVLLVAVVVAQLRRAESVPPAWTSRPAFQRLGSSTVTLMPVFAMGLVLAVGMGLLFGSSALHGGTPDDPLPPTESPWLVGLEGFVTAAMIELLGAIAVGTCLMVFPRRRTQLTLVFGLGRGQSAVRLPIGKIARWGRRAFCTVGLLVLVGAPYVLGSFGANRLARGDTLRVWSLVPGVDLLSVRRYELLAGIDSPPVLRPGDCVRKLGSNDGSYVLLTEEGFVVRAPGDILLRLGCARLP